MSEQRVTKHKVTARTKARRRAVEVLYEADQRGELNGPKAGQALEALANERAVTSANPTVAPEYARLALKGVAQHLRDIDQILQTYTQEWSLERMPAVDRAIARLSVWEIVYNDEVDPPVSVDEAMTLARMLSTDESPRFLNGLLGRIADLAPTLK